MSRFSKKHREAAFMVMWVKGKIWPCIAEWTEAECESLINSYTRRLWWNEEAGAYRPDEEAFEEKWNEFRSLHEAN